MLPLSKLRKHWRFLAFGILQPFAYYFALKGLGQGSADAWNTAIFFSVMALAAHDFYLRRKRKQTAR